MAGNGIDFFDAVANVWNVYSAREIAWTHENYSVVVNFTPQTKSGIITVTTTDTVTSSVINQVELNSPRGFGGVERTPARGSVDVLEFGDGTFAVAWAITDAEDNGYGYTYLQTFDADGQAVGSTINVFPDNFKQDWGHVGTDDFLIEITGTSTADIGATFHGRSVYHSTTTDSVDLSSQMPSFFDVSAISDINAVADALLENASSGDEVGIKASATDADGTNNTVTYSLTSNPGSLFAIDGSTGVVTLSGSLDYETATSHTIEVTASSTDEATQTKRSILKSLRLTLQLIWIWVL